MRKISLVILGSALGIVLGAASANAQATRTWVSGVGDDANPCSRTAPCKTFAGAISKTAAGGEISALDPAGFGAITITKSITINGDGTLAGILAALTNGVIVNAGANDKVILRNLSINGAGNGLDGVRFLAGGQVTVDNCAIYGFTGDGIDVAKAASGSLIVEDTYISNIAKGIRVSTTGGFVNATLDNVSIYGANTNGVELASNNVFSSITDSTFLNTTGVAIGTTIGNGVINLDNSLLSNNGTGVSAASSGSIIRLANNSLYNNTTGISIGAGATVASAANNRVVSSGASAAPNGTIPLQ